MRLKTKVNWKKQKQNNIILKNNDNKNKKEPKLIELSIHMLLTGSVYANIPSESGD